MIRDTCDPEWLPIEGRIWVKENMGREPGGETYNGLEDIGKVEGKWGSSHKSKLDRSP